MSKFSLTPKQIVHELDKYIIGQDSAKKSVAIALRNRWRRQQVTSDIRDEILPNNIIMIGSTGVGKTEIARRLSNLVQAPFVKVEASKFTEVGYVGRDVDSMIRDLVENSYAIVKAEHEITVHEKAIEMTNDRIMDLLLPPLINPDKDSDDYQRYLKTREKMFAKLMAGDFEDRQVEFKVQEDGNTAMMQIFSPLGMDDLGMNIQDMLGNAMPKKNKMRRLSVTEARVLITAEESDKLIDEEKVQHEAIRRAEQDGIVFVDEIDKIAVERGGSGPDVSREGVQRDILPIIEGSTVKTKYGTLTTDHVLFIAAGAFHMSKPSDLIPELQGRFPIRVELENLTEDDFIQILTQPKSALLKQYTALVGAEDVKISFNKDAIEEIARVAFEVNESVENIGARRLHTIMSKLLEETLFDLPDEKTKSIRVTKSMVTKTFKDTMADQDLSKYIL
ncbi:MAG: ATP-dependent protease ATPase subunit HslU [Candidatus Marinimicrobia bacterium]|jgi:ATP-dependent HslUV protease ATP-binding subunit HslU|nr:ATP-dependent protease ATPase subunit HslU [Candidatus Neomarinimicrobiota bacterium]MBT3632507.1 ATP-dependent protease ATPase subunit HslU [Candidatus Neomarinimicrobiota bacterium]MBT3824906.1 ATP-dependent protease ATPase subunit HslU [Candidatus Neomarinimicrobiota bacterium]MBT4132775.1 ATP-dependent protease ATPase subunit HslU [Candidatus Neomarinimicrobiota bacterium]MBT4295303.1 ATP-dependent protease ATPase subunit HslU [Candidatus Neomarinimicrobiota bacterium]